MVNRNQLYKCDVCGNIVEVAHVGGGTLVCCGQQMRLLTENTVDAAKEKHVPVVEKTPGGFNVKVGAVGHPMEEKHWIQWIELLADDRLYRQQLKPGTKPEAMFPIQADKVVARAYCNLHGNWRS